MSKTKEPLTDSKKVRLALSLIGRSLHTIVRLSDAVANSDYIDTTGKLKRLTEMLHAISVHLIDEQGPDSQWFRDYFLVTGQHMVQTEEGWIPAELNSRDVTGEEPMEVLDEVNAP